MRHMYVFSSEQQNEKVWRLCMSQVLNERSVEIFEKELFIEICVEIAIRNCDRKNKASNWWMVCNSSSFLSPMTLCLPFPFLSALSFIVECTECKGKALNNRPCRPRGF